MELSVQQQAQQDPTLSLARVRLPILAMMTLVVAVIALFIGVSFRNLDHESELLLDSTVGELAVWMTDQSEEDEAPSLLGGYAKDRAIAEGVARLDDAVLLDAMQTLVFGWCVVVALLAIAGVVGLVRQSGWDRTVLLLVLIGLDVLLFIIPTMDGNNTLVLVILGVILTLAILLFSPGRITRVLGFFVVLSVIFVSWEGVKAFADSVNYRITLGQPAWGYTTYPTIEDTLAALEGGEVDLVIIDRNDVDEIMPAFPPDEDEPLEDPAYSGLVWLDDFIETQSLLSFPVIPEFPGRLTVVVRAEDSETWASVADILGENIATVEGEFADDRYLPEPRELVLVDLEIFNDLNLPHLQAISEAFLQPARRNGPFLLVRILADAALFTWGEAVFGFAFGATLGFLLGALFAHSALMERSLLPYVVASQTVPILAIAPMVVIWLGASPFSVAVIAAYITFFPVTVNTLRGLTSPSPTAVELMRSYAATRWEIMWKLRFPAALPYIFTALKVSATASVVGAIIGELPSGISDGLGRAILNFSSDYSLVSTPKLWASIVMAAFVGIIFFVIVSLVEHFTLRRYVRAS